MEFASTPLIMKLLLVTRAPFTETFWELRPTAVLSGNYVAGPVESPRIWVKFRVARGSWFSVRDRAGTSHVERKNGTLRQWCKRQTRLTYAFSRSWDNLRAALALHFAYYNLCRIHGSLRITPAMAAGIADHVWTLEELIA